MAQIIININDAKFTAAAWRGFTRHVAPGAGDDVSTPAKKLEFVGDYLKRHLAGIVTHGMRANERDAASLTPDDFDVTE